MSAPVLKFHDGTLILIDWEHSHSPPFFNWDPRAAVWRAPAAYYSKIMDTFKKNQLVLENEASHFTRLELHFIISTELLPYQQESLVAWKNSNFCGTVILPTGTGKTLVGLSAMALVKISTLVVCPTLDLMNQWYGRITDSFGIEVGILGGGFHEIRPITVTTYDSAYRHIDRYGDRFGLLIFDEIHHLPAPVFAQIPELSMAPFRLGLTATYRRPDVKHLQLTRLIGPVIYEKQIKDMKGIHLSEYEIRRIVVPLTLKEKTLYAAHRETYQKFVRENKIRFWGNRWEQFIKESSANPKAREALLSRAEMRRIVFGAKEKLEALESILKQHVQDRTLVFTQDNALVYTISQSYLIPSITHQTDTVERKFILDRFRKGEYRILVTSKVLNEGVDMPDANVAVILGGSASPVEHLQRLGRILRKKSGKKAVLYEIVTEGTQESGISYRRRGSDAYR